jgi:phage FluMu protein gp41
MVAIPLLTLSANLHAQDAKTIDDVHCVIVGARLAGQSDSSKQSVGVMMTLYYVGRLDGRMPTLDLQSLIRKELSSITAADYEYERKRCGDRMAEKGKQIQQIGKDIASSKNATDG